MASPSDRIEAELENIDQVIAKIPNAGELPDLSDLELAGVAALLHSFYNGVENIIKQLMMAKELPIPTGESWHKDLIQKAREASIISLDMENSIKEYLAFRHFFSHAYAFDLDPERLEPLVANLGSVHSMFRSEVDQLNQ